MRYDYKCFSCGEVVEKVHSMHESPEYECPTCATRLERVIRCSKDQIQKGFDGSTYYEIKNRPPADDTKQFRKRSFVPAQKSFTGAQ